MKWPLIFLTILLAGLTLITCEPPTKSDDDGVDTTSHDFTWRVDTLGGIFSTAISIEIVSETEVYVGGEFFVYPNPDDLSVSDRYNLAVWDGFEWVLEKVMFVGYNNAPESIEPIKIIKHFANGHLFLVSNFNSVAIFDGKSWSSFYKLEGGDKKYCWARSETDIYFAGRGGAFTHYDGNTFTSIPTGVTNDFIDIWGDDQSVWITSNDLSSPAFAFGEFQNNKFRIVDNNPGGESRFPFGYISVCKPKPNSPLYVLIQGITIEVKSTNPLSYSTMYNHVESGYYFYWLRGNDSNDLYMGDRNTQSFAHYNGKTWKTFTVNGEGQEAFTIKGNLVGGCGNNSNLNPPRVYIAKRF